MPVTPSILLDSISACMLADQQRLRRRVRQLERDRVSGARLEDQIRRLLAEAEESARRRRLREERLPKPTYPEELPVSAMREEIKAAIAEHQVVVICGETGSGKTTQLPKICLDLGRGVAGLIGHTQPRRIAARSVAARIAQELDTPLGEAVGFKVRFGDRTSERTYVKLMTDGILLAETQADRLLSAYDTLIVDAAHERRLHIDFLLGYLRQLLPRRPDLRVIVTSATIDPQRFSTHFGRTVNGVFTPAPIVMVPGRTYPVDVEYLPPMEGDQEHEAAPDLESAVLRAVDAAAERGPGDILIFFPGEREIRECAEALRKHHPPGVEIVPLYARLSPDEQMRVFDRHSTRRIVLATNVAETSLTVPGIRYVIDTGSARVKRYNPRTRVTRLPVEAISRASADQRKGRAGRLGPGVCFRLYSREDFASRDEFTTPEILRANLAQVILQMLALRLGRVEDFPFVEPPDARSVRTGYDTLEELGAIDDRGELTALGRDMAKLPIDPRLSRLLLAAEQEQRLAEALIIASALAAQDPRERPMDAAEAADQAHRKFADPDSDFLTLLNLWSWFQEHKRHLSQSKLRKLLRANFVSFLRMREWEEVHRQLHEQMSEMGHRSETYRGAWHGSYRHDETDSRGGASIEQPDSHSRTKQDEMKAEALHAPLHRAILAGLLSGVGKKGEESGYSGPRGGEFTIWPGSTLFRRGPRWIVAAEIVQTSRVFARTVAKIHPDWIEQVGAHLIRRAHSEPHWDREHGTVFAFERVTLWGLEIAAKRRVHYGPVNAKHAREIFIHHALVESDAEHHGGYFAHNRELFERAAGVEAKARRHGLLADSQARFAFFDRRVPTGVWSMAAFEKWRRVAERDNPRLLFMEMSDVLVEDDPRVTEEAYPDAITIGGEPASPSAAPRGGGLNIPAFSAFSGVRPRKPVDAAKPASAVGGTSGATSGVSGQPPVAIPIQYKFDPGGEDDGVTLSVPLHSIAGLSPERCEWLVPGMLREKIVELVRLLPKSLRHFVPSAPEFAEACVKDLAFGNRPLAEVLSERLGSMIGTRVPPESWKFDELPTHLRMNVRVFDERRRLIASGRDPRQLREQLTPLAAERFAEFARDRFDRDGVTDWDFGDLPERVELERFGVKLIGYPAVIDRGQSVSLRLLQSKGEAEHRSRAGVRRLLWLRARRDLRLAFKALPTIDSMSLLYAPIGDRDAFREQLELLIAERTYMRDGAAPRPIRSGGDFERAIETRSGDLYRVAMGVADEVGEILKQHHAASLAIGRKFPDAWRDSLDDARLHFALLSDVGFLTAAPPQWLPHLPRFFKGVQSRLAKLANAGLEKDERATAELRPLWIGYLTRAKHNHDHDRVEPALDEHRWLLEELRISLFAQELRTSVQVSMKRLYEHWERVVLAKPEAAKA